MESRDNIVRTEFDFIGLLKKWRTPPGYIKLVFQYNKGDILDVGCATCKLYTFLQKKGWKGKYSGIDSQEYDNYDYPEEVNLVIGNALEVKFPKVDTVVLNNILEHVDKPVVLLKKAIKAARQNIIINVPKRNEEMWKYGIVEYHQLDKTHKHCGFSKEEVYKIVDLADRRITRWKELDGITVIPLNLFHKRLGLLLLNPKLGKYISPKKTFYITIWCEVVKKMKIGIYTPYLNAYGGGEKYICKIAEILSEKNSVEFIVLEKLDKIQFQDKLNVNLNKVGINYIKIPNLLNRIPYFRTLIRIYTISRISKNYDLFINQENNTVIPSQSRKSIFISQLPTRKLGELSLLKPINNILVDPQLNTYHKIITYSLFNKKHIQEWWNKSNIDVLYPPIEKIRSSIKKNIILCVGRFFIIVNGHNKKQLEMIRFFKQLYKENKILKDWEYHLVGGLSENIKDQEYLEKCKEEARSYPVYFHINVAFQDLKELYGMAKIFWHATGFNEDEKKHPERMEHFGMTTGEAMSAGCVPVVINGGGQPEIVRNLIDGFLWNNTEELKKYTLKLISNNNLWQKMSQTSIKRSQEFGINKFRERVKLIINDI